MGVDKKPSTARKGESAKKPVESARPPKEHKERTDDFKDLTDDVNKLWTSWTSAPSPGDMWRRIEQFGIDNTLRMLSRVRGETCLLSSIGADEAWSLTNLMVQMTELLSCIRLAYVDNEKDIFDSNEREKRYLKTTCPAILEIWSGHINLAASAMMGLVKKSWQNTIEHENYLHCLCNMAGAATKLVVLAADTAAYHSLDDAETLQTAAIHETEEVVTQLTKVAEMATNLSEVHPAMELIGWELYGVSHVAERVLKVDIEARAEKFEDFECLSKCVDNMLKQLALLREEEEEEQEEAPPQKEVTPEKKGGKNSAKGKNDKKGVKEQKVETPIPTEEKKISKEDCLEMVRKIMDAYQKFSDGAWEGGRLPVMKGASEAQIRYRMESYREIGKLRIEPCPVLERKSLLESLALTEDHNLVSDMYVIVPEGLNCSQEVTVEFPVLGHTSGEKSALHLRVKVDGKWEDIKDPDKKKIDGFSYITFNTTKCEAFVALTEYASDDFVITPQGATYLSPDVPGLEMTFQPGCVDEDVPLNVKPLHFDKSVQNTSFYGIVNASVGIEIISSTPVDMKKLVTIQVPMKDDVEEKDTELVVARYDGKTVQILDKKQLGLKALQGGIFCVETKKIQCCAVLRIKRIFLNMRESIKKEFLVGYGKALLCNILTFIDDISRGQESMTFVMECVEKCHVDKVVEGKEEIGLIEIKKSRSKDILLKTGDEILVATDGQIRPSEPMPDENYVICFLQLGVNIKHVTCEIKRDPEKLPDAVLLYKKQPDNQMLHSVFILTRDLSELPTDDITARTGVNTHITEANKKEKQVEESAVQILKHESLMSLARELTFEECENLGEQLGVSQEKINRIQEDYGGEKVVTNFRILTDWRGTSPRAAMADFLVSSLRAVGKQEYAEIVVDVRKKQRGLERADFSCRKK